MITKEVREEIFERAARREVTHTYDQDERIMKNLVELGIPNPTREDVNLVILKSRGKMLSSRAPRAPRASAEAIEELALQDVSHMLA